MQGRPGVAHQWQTIMICSYRIRLSSTLLAMSLAPATHTFFTRRHFVSMSAVAASMALVPRQNACGQSPTVPARRKLRVAAINSIFRLRSHAYHILGRMVFGFQKDGLHHQPDLEVVRMYNDQAPADDL